MTKTVLLLLQLSTLQTDYQIQKMDPTPMMILRDLIDLFCFPLLYTSCLTTSMSMTSAPPAFASKPCGHR